MRKITVAFHTLGSLDYSHSRFYRTLSTLYDIDVVHDAPIHIYIDYPDYIPMHKDYRITTNIHVSELVHGAYLPDMNMFDYAIGNVDFMFEDRYFNISESEKSLHTYLRHIFDSEHTKKRSNAVIHLYYDTKDNVWDNYRFLKKYDIKRDSLFYTILNIAIRIFKLVKLIRK